MKGIAFLSGLISGFLTFGTLPASSQVTSDGTTNTTVNTNGNNFNILNGIQKGNNLFHSFKEFSIPTGSSATFQTKGAIENIINRVTGGNISNIDGLIKANGSANLFLINPSGIVFGENARLDIGGSFLGSTAESILFEDGFEFSAVNAQSEPLLTISVPLGLQMGSNSGDITVRGNGHTLSTINSFSALETRDTSSGLRVNSGNTLALIGGNLALNGGIVSADGGHIILGAVASKNSNPVQINLNNEDTSWNPDYSQVEEFKNINLTKRAVIDASGLSSGSIQIQGQTVSFKDASLITIENQGEQPGGDIQINATKLLELADSPNANPKIDGFNTLRNGIFYDAKSSGKAGNIIISTDELLMQNGGGDITNRTFTGTNGGSVFINSKDINILSSSTINSGAIITRTLGAGNSGNVTINTERLKILNQGFIGASSRSSGLGGNITINAQEKIEFTAPDFSDFGSPGIAASALSESGNAGNIMINTGKLVLRDGMVISSSTFGNGNSGSIIINASEVFEIGGTRLLDNQDGTTTAEGSNVRSAAIVISRFARQLFDLPDVPGGDGGDITINTPRLNLNDLGLITVRNDGTGDAGNLTINAESISLNNQGGITATTASGEGGNIQLNLKSDLILRNNSVIDTEALGAGNGGNITMNSPVILGLENSDIIANAVKGNGGNINIKTQGLFGLKFSEQLSDKSDITASSQFGLSGQVILQKLDFNPVTNLVKLPSNFENKTQIQAGCRPFAENKFVVLGRDALPQRPSDLFNGSKVLVILLDLIDEVKIPYNTSPQNNNLNYDNQKKAIIEATGFIRNENGEIELVALENTPLRNQQTSECSVKHK